MSPRPKPSTEQRTHPRLLIRRSRIAGRSTGGLADHAASLLHIGRAPSPPAIDSSSVPLSGLPRPVFLVVAPAPTLACKNVPVLAQSCTGSSQVFDKPVTCLLPASDVSHYLEVVQRRN